MVATVRQLCMPREGAFDLSVGEQIDRLDQVLASSETQAEEFFAKNHVTAGLKVLLSEGLSRLAGRSDRPLYELRQAMGGGKTHSMVALGLLARNPILRGKYFAEFAHGKALGDTRVVALDGRGIDRSRYIWGDLITQLGKAEEGAVFWKEGPKPPSKKDWLALIGSEPTLILLDELPPYLDHALAVPAGEATLGKLAKFALSNLFAAAIELPRCCIVISSLTGTYKSSSNDLHDLANEAMRQARPLTPVDLATDEIYSILKRRLFANLPDEAAINGVAEAYNKTISQAITAQAVPSTARQIVEEIPQTYPFHPSVKHIIALFRNNETFRQTRGLMQIASRMMLSVWERPSDDVTLIGCQHLDLSIQDVRDELNRVRDLQGAVAHDIFGSGQAVAERIDAELGGDCARQAASTLLAASLSSSVDAVQGFTEDQLIEYLISPSTGAREYRDAFDKLRKGAWYLHRNKSDAWYFSPAENLYKLIEDRALRAPQPRIDEEMRRRLRDAFRPRGAGVYERVDALPKISEVDLRGSRVCVVLEPEAQQPTEALKSFFGAAVEKNNLCVVTGDGSRFADLESAVRKVYGTHLAQQQMLHNQPDKLREAEDLLAEAEQAVNSTIIGLFNKTIYPSFQGLTVATLQLTPAGAKDRGEEDVAAALSALGAQKVVRDLESEADRLILRVEELLWPARDRKARWADIEDRARTNPRWPWIEPKGLVRLRERAKGRGRWRDSNDGWIEKGPFPPDRTKVNLIPGHYDQSTGQAEVSVQVQHAGKSPQVYWAEKSDVSRETGELLKGDILKTEATALWFVAVDPDGQHETGPATPWKNQLTITHDVHSLPDGRRRVTLAVRPDVSRREGGVLKWNIQGTNPKEGQDFKDEIIITSPLETRIWIYAAHGGVEASRSFVVPATNGEGPQLDLAKPATLNKRWSIPDTATTFSVLKITQEKEASLKLSKVVVGEGEAHVQMRFGSGVALSSEILNSLVSVSRTALNNDLANVAVDISAIKFASGADLEDFLRAQKLDASSEEIEQ